jgi:murein DD-endopeptidase MepM/ murein hydrolase activator NlpD
MFPAANLLAATALLCSAAASAQTFPIAGERHAYTGRSRDTVPDAPPAAYRIAPAARWYYEWPTPQPAFSYREFKSRRRVGKNQEPGYGACRPSAELPQGCGRPHQGVDIYAHYGTPIVAPEDGYIVSYRGSDVYAAPGSESRNGGAGRLFRLRGNSGYVYSFLHTMGFSARVAARAGVAKDFGEAAETPLNVPVTAGEIIGYVGGTGGVVNPHLHLEVARGGQVADPASVLREATASASLP